MHKRFIIDIRSSSLKVYWSNLVTLWDMNSACINCSFTLSDTVTVSWRKQLAFILYFLSFCFSIPFFCTCIHISFSDETQLTVPLPYRPFLSCVLDTWVKFSVFWCLPVAGFYILCITLTIYCTYKKLSSLASLSNRFAINWMLYYLYLSFI